MSIAGISSTAAPVFDPSAFQTVRNRVQSDFSQIAQSLNANNLAGAQQAYSDLVKLTPAGSAATGSGSPLQGDLASLGAALQSGDLSSAQKAFQKLAADASTAAQNTESGAPAGHHHRHVSSAASSTTPPASAGASAASTPATTGSVLGALIKTGISLLG